MFPYSPNNFLWFAIVCFYFCLCFPSCGFFLRLFWDQLLILDFLHHRQRLCEKCRTGMFMFKRCVVECCCFSIIIVVGVPQSRHSHLANLECICFFIFLRLAHMKRWGSQACLLLLIPFAHRLDACVNNTCVRVLNGQAMSRSVLMFLGNQLYTCTWLLTH